MTQVWEYIKMALMNIKSNKGRSLLTMLGIIIGISSVILVISVGNDGIANIDQFDFINQYEILIDSIRKASPNTWILCIPMTSVSLDYVLDSGLTLTKSNEARTWLQTVCSDTGAYYCDAVSAVQDVSGMLLQESSAFKDVAE